MNDGYLPNLSEPNKWMVSVDGMFDWQKEKLQNSDRSYQLTHSNFNLFFGGQKFRGGVQVVHDFSHDIKDLSVGLGVAFNRPVFLELGAGYLNRVMNTTSFDGWSYNAKVGYSVDWVMQIKYRLRIRMAMMFNYKTINSGYPQGVYNFYPFLGLEFET